MENSGQLFVILLTQKIAVRYSKIYFIGDNLGVLVESLLVIVKLSRR